MVTLLLVLVRTVSNRRTLGCRETSVSLFLLFLFVGTLMSNFWKLGIARESVFIEDSVYSLTPEEEALMLSEAETKVNELDYDLSMLDDDTDRVSALMDVKPGLDSALVAQESIRKRWGITKRCAVGTESLLSDLKGLLSRFIFWLKEKASAGKDLWFKFYNTGRTIKRRSAKYKIQIFKCHNRRKDMISGRFIERLTAGGVFIGSDIQAMKQHMTLAKDGIKAQERLTNAIVDSVNRDLSGTSPKYASALTQDGHYGNSTKRYPVLGHRVLFAEESYDDDENPYSRLSFPPTLKDDISPTVFTPKVQALERINDFYYILGRELEREITNAQFVEKTHLKLAGTMSKLLSTIDSVDGDVNKMLAAKRAAKYARVAASKCATISSVSMFTWRNLAGGLGGYIQEAIKAFD